MTKLKIMTIVGTRPELIKLSRVLANLDKHTNHVLVHTGQNFDYELNEIFYQQLQIRTPDHYLDAGGETAAETIANTIFRVDAVLQEECADGVLVLGDTNSCLSVIAAKRRKIPIFHMEAGNRCFDQRVPEEINRKIVDHLSDINMPYTEHARRYLLAEGLRSDLVIKTGSPMREVLEFAMAQVEGSRALEELGVTPRRYFVVSAHREENVDCPDRLKTLIGVLNTLAKKYDMPVIVSTHPRTRKRLENIDTSLVDERIRLLKPLGFVDYVKLQSQAYCVLSDSGTITEECAIVGFPAVTLRDAHERPEGMDEGTLVMTGLDEDRVCQGVEFVASRFHDQGRRTRLPSDYESRDVSDKVVCTILSYVDYVRRVVWQQRA